ncbi:hypothetical protein PBRA_006227 [Plasmodiophora brassicae]|uniref:Sulfhydryl oxidase n=1 Tax=Plasmodiophora brassicae TaxID=37360 RepID=A0A0G4IRZ9_PLABS|nr:hypothetical protein PBRA_006227 [Plasmodiophora brassicae]
MMTLHMGGRRVDHAAIWWCRHREAIPVERAQPFDTEVGASDRFRKPGAGRCAAVCVCVCVSSLIDGRPHRRLRMPTTSQRCRQLVSAVCLQYRGAVIACTFVLLAMVGIASWSLAPRTNRLATLRGPLTRAELGHATWSLLHTMAAKFPDNATSAQQNDYRQFMHLLARLYPCHECAGHFQVASATDCDTAIARCKPLCRSSSQVRHQTSEVVTRLGNGCVSRITSYVGAWTRQNPIAAQTTCPTSGHLTWPARIVDALPRSTDSRSRVTLYKRLLHCFRRFAARAGFAGRPDRFGPARPGAGLPFLIGALDLFRSLPWCLPDCHFSVIALARAAS